MVAVKLAGRNSSQFHDDNSYNNLDDFSKGFQDHEIQSDAAASRNQVGTLVIGWNVSMNWFNCRLPVQHSQRVTGIDDPLE